MTVMNAVTLKMQKSATHENGQETPLVDSSLGSSTGHSSPPDLQASRKVKSGILTLAPIHQVPDRHENAVGDEITAWWQNRLGKQAVLGQMGNRTRLGHHLRLPILLWTKPAVDSTPQEEAVGRVTSHLAEGQSGNLPGAQSNGPRVWVKNTLNAVAQLGHRSGMLFSGAVLFLAVSLLRVVSAVVVASCAIIAFPKTALGQARQ